MMHEIVEELRKPEKKRAKELRMQDRLRRKEFRRKLRMQLDKKY